MRRPFLFAFLVALVAASLLLGSPVWARKSEITAVIEDGDVEWNDPNYIRDNTDNTIHVYFNTHYRGYIEWNISEIPHNAVITSVAFKFRKSGGGDDDFDVYDMSNQPSTSSNSTVYNDAKNGDTYGNIDFNISDGAWKTVALNSNAVSDLQAAVSANQTWFAIGLYAAPTVCDFYSSESGSTPTLVVGWYLPGDARVAYKGPYYENGTLVNATTKVTVVGESYTEELNLYHSNVTSYYAEQPLYVTWEISSGIYRRYYISDLNETIYIFYPEDTFTSFAFTVKDFTGATSLEDTLFATRRTINGTERTIERVPIENTINNIPVTLVINRAYAIVLYVGSSYTQKNTFFSNTLDLTPTIVLNEISFSRQIQLASKWIYVDADRPTATSLRVNYTNTRGDTNSVTVRIRFLNGTLVNQTTFTTDSFTYTYSPVDNETSYYFDLTIDTDFIVTPWKKVLPWTPSFNDIPDLSVLGSLGGLNMKYLIGLIFIIGVALIFSGKDISIACFSITITTGIAAYYGFFPLSRGAIGLMVLISIGGALALRGR